MIPLSQAVADDIASLCLQQCRGSTHASSPSRSTWNAVGPSSTLAVAVALRLVAGLSPTSTILALPAESTCVSFTLPCLSLSPATQPQRSCKHAAGMLSRLARLQAATGVDAGLDASRVGNCCRKTCMQAGVQGCTGHWACHCSEQRGQRGCSRQAQCSEAGGSARHPACKSLHACRGCTG